MKMTKILCAFFLFGLLACSGGHEETTGNEASEAVESPLETPVVIASSDDDGDSQGADEEESEATRAKTTRHLKKWNEGVNFQAMGNEPSWNLDIDFDRGMLFSALDGMELTTPMGTPEHADDGEVRKYHATTESGEIIVELDDTECADNMSGEPFDYTVKVSVKYGVDQEFKEYSGCGEYIVDPRLHNIWIIEKFEGKEIDHTKFAKGVPQIEINVRDDVYMGHDGCNAFRGSIAFSAAKVTFSSGPSTLMACEDQPESGRISRELVAGALAVDFDNGRLNLSRDGNVVFVLKNVD